MICIPLVIRDNDRVVIVADWRELVSEPAADLPTLLVSSRTGYAVVAVMQGEITVICTRGTRAAAREVIDAIFRNLPLPHEANPPWCKVDITAVGRPVAAQPAGSVDPELQSADNLPSNTRPGRPVTYDSGHSPPEYEHALNDVLGWDVGTPIPENTTLRATLIPYVPLQTLQEIAESPGPYRVSYEIDVEAETPEDAAEQCLDSIRDSIDAEETQIFRVVRLMGPYCPRVLTPRAPTEHLIEIDQLSDLSARYRRIPAP